VITKFGSEAITDELLERITKITSHRIPLHSFLKRKIFFSHRDMKFILDHYEKGQPFYLYTGRGPSQQMHIGHLIPFMFTQYLQEAFNVPVIIQITDDEKFMSKNHELTMEQSRYYARENIRDIIACGFNPKKTFIFCDLDSMGFLYPNVCRIQKLISNNQIRSIFGVDGSDNIGKTAFPAIQAAPAFSSTFPQIFPNTKNIPCLIPCGIDQDPYFRMTRDISQRLHHSKPALIHSKFLPSVRGQLEKMSASDPNSAIYLTDSSAEIKRKIMKYAYSGGRDTLEEQRKYGADLSVDIPFLYLSFFLDNDEELTIIKKAYETGSVLTSEVKKRLVTCLTELVMAHQKKRSAVTEEIMNLFMSMRPLI